MWGCYGGQAFGKDAVTAVWSAAKPLAYAQLPAYAVRYPRHISQGPFIVTVDAMRRCGAQRTTRDGLGGSHAYRDLHRGVIDLTRLKAQCGDMGSQVCEDVVRRC